MDPAQKNPNPNSPATPSSVGQTWTPPPPDWSVPPVNFYPDENKPLQPPEVLPKSTPVPMPQVVVSPPVVSPNPTPAIKMDPVTNNSAKASSNPTETKPKKSRGLGNKLLIIVLLFIIVGCVGATVYFLLFNKSSQLPTSVNEQAVVPSATSSAQTPILTASNHELLYIKSSNIYHYLLGNNKETQLTLDGNQQIRYHMPKFAGSLISFIRCDHKSVDYGQPYSCSLVKQQMNGSTPVEIARLDSRADSNGAHIGAQIKTYAWDTNASQVAYLVEGINTDNKITTNLYLGGGATESAVKLDTFTDTAGRGGSPDDTVSILFSPSGKKLLLDYTFLYPVTNEADDRGTLFVYDLTTKKLIWSAPKMWVAFAHWSDDDHIIAKSQSLSGSSNGPWNLVKLDITKPSTNPQSITTVVEAPSWNDIEPLTASKSVQLVFWSADSSPSSGIVLEQLDLGTKIKKSLMKNLVKLAVLDKSSLIVNTMKACKDDCGMDYYNGYVADAVALYQLDTKKLQLLNLASGSALPSEFSAK